jgi:hypothetical protein
MWRTFNTRRMLLRRRLISIPPWSNGQGSSLRSCEVEVRILWAGPLVCWPTYAVSLREL